MNENEFDRTARAWLDDGPTRMSDRALLSALEEIHTTRQRRALWPARRATPVNIFARAAIAAVLVVGVGLVAFNLLPGQPDGSGVGGQPSASPSSEGFGVAFDLPGPVRRRSRPDADLRLVVQRVLGRLPGRRRDPAGDGGLESLVEQDNADFDFIHANSIGSFRGVSTEAPDGVAIDDWIDRYRVRFEIGGCGVRRSEQPEITIDGQPGRIWEGCPNEIEATVVFGQRMYLFTLFGDAGVSRAVFDAYASTIDLRPEEAAGGRRAQAPS